MGERFQKPCSCDKCLKMRDHMREVLGPNYLKGTLAVVAAIKENV